jgi:ATP-dependent Clp protease ATP-binding subunit ClpA
VFDRCDADATTVVETALEEARRLGHNYLGTEHLLLALVRHRELLPESVRVMFPNHAVMLSAAVDTLGAEPAAPDAELLKVVGIDLDEVRSAVRQTFGADALDQLGRRRVHQPWQPWRRPTRRCTSLLAGVTSVAPRVKQALERGLIDAARRQRDAVDPAALLLGMLQTEGAMSNELLRRTRVDPDRLHQLLLSYGS